MPTYYNDSDRRCAAWLRELMAEGLISAGVVDDRPIQEVTADDLRGFDRVHLFAGIGGWDLALALAGWPHDRPVWTASCPCQPFSTAGRRRGAADERHLWPEALRLVRAARPVCLFGEQVAGSDGWRWFDDVRGDLEGEAFEVGALGLGAGGVGAPHKRSRIYFVADATGPGRLRERAATNGRAGPAKRGLKLGDAGLSGLPQRKGESGDTRKELEAAVRAGWHRPWDRVEWVLCDDPSGARWRPTQPGLEPLVAGLPGRVALLRGAGNAIVPQVAASFIEAYLRC